MNSNELYMQEAYIEALKAYKKNEVPIGCVIVHNNKIIARAHNLRNTKRNSLYHAEVLAINKACKKLNKWILDDCTIYVTMEMGAEYRFFRDCTQKEGKNHGRRQ